MATSLEESAPARCQSTRHIPAEAKCGSMGVFLDVRDILIAAGAHWDIGQAALVETTQLTLVLYKQNLHTFTPTQQQFVKQRMALNLQVTEGNLLRQILLPTHAAAGPSTRIPSHVLQWVKSNCIELALLCNIVDEKRFPLRYIPADQLRAAEQQHTASTDLADTMPKAMAVISQATVSEGRSSNSTYLEFIDCAAPISGVAEAAHAGSDNAGKQLRRSLAGEMAVQQLAAAWHDYQEPTLAKNTATLTAAGVHSSSMLPTATPATDKTPIQIPMRSTAACAAGALSMPVTSVNDATDINSSSERTYRGGSLANDHAAVNTAAADTAHAFQKQSFDDPTPAAITISKAPTCNTPAPAVIGAPTSTTSLEHNAPPAPSAAQIHAAPLLPSWWLAAATPPAQSNLAVVQRGAAGPMSPPLSTPAQSPFAAQFSALPGSVPSPSSLQVAAAKAAVRYQSMTSNTLAAQAHAAAASGRRLTSWGLAGAAQPGSAHGSLLKTAAAAGGPAVPLLAKFASSAVGAPAATGLAAAVVSSPWWQQAAAMQSAVARGAAIPSAAAMQLLACGASPQAAAAAAVMQAAVARGILASNAAAASKVLPSGAPAPGAVVLGAPIAQCCAGPFEKTAAVPPAAAQAALEVPAPPIPNARARRTARRLEQRSMAAGTHTVEAGKHYIPNTTTADAEAAQGTVARAVNAAPGLSAVERDSNPSLSYMPSASADDSTPGSAAPASTATHFATDITGASATSALSSAPACDEQLAPVPPVLSTNDPSPAAHAAAEFPAEASAGARLLALLQKSTAAPALPEQYKRPLANSPHPGPAKSIAPQQMHPADASGKRTCSQHSSAVAASYTAAAAAVAKLEHSAATQQMQQQEGFSHALMPSKGVADTAAAVTTAASGAQTRWHLSTPLNDQQQSTPLMQRLQQGLTASTAAQVFKEHPQYSDRPRKQQQQQRWSPDSSRKIAPDTDAVRQQAQQQAQAGHAASNKQQQQQRPLRYALSMQTSRNWCNSTGAMPDSSTSAGDSCNSFRKGNMVLQARVPDGTRGFTMGRGAWLSAPSAGKERCTALAPGSNSGVVAAGPLRFAALDTNARDAHKQYNIVAAVETAAPEVVTAARTVSIAAESSAVAAARSTVSSMASFRAAMPVPAITAEPAATGSDVTAVGHAVLLAPALSMSNGEALTQPPDQQAILLQFAQQHAGPGTCPATARNQSDTNSIARMSSSIKGSLSAAAAAQDTLSHVDQIEGVAAAHALEGDAAPGISVLHAGAASAAVPEAAAGFVNQDKRRKTRQEC